MIIEAKEAFQFDTIDDVVSDIAKGRMVIVTDDADRENEGDLVIAADKVTPEAVNFMAKHGRGLLFVPISNAAPEEAAGDNEGVLVMSPAKATPDAVNSRATRAAGLFGGPFSNERANEPAAM